MAIIRVAGFDPSFANWGFSKSDLDTDTWRLKVVETKLVATAPGTSKVVRRNSDDIRRTRDLIASISPWIEDCTIVFSEVPSGAQSARAAFSFGVVIGLLSHLTNLVEVQPSETKIAATGSKHGSKDEIVEWAAKNHPEVPWPKRMYKGKLQYLGYLEHLADAVAVTYAGVRTDEFKRTVAMLTSMGSIKKVA